MNTIIVMLVGAALILGVVWLIGRALRDFNDVEAGGNVGKAGFFIKAKGKKK
jgi:hypothetical protein